MSVPDDITKRANHIRRWSQGEKPAPLALTLGPTEACNLRCRFCALRRATQKEHEARRKQELPDEVLIRLVKEAAQLGIEVVNVSGGGEPFLRAGTLKVMKAIKQNGMKGAITTNGTLLTDTMAKAIVDMKWDRIDVSIDGPDADTHDSLRDSKGSFKRSTDAVRSLVQWKNKLGSDSPEIWLYTVLTNENHTKLGQMITLCYELGVRNFELIPVTVHHDEGATLKLRKSHWKDFEQSLGEAISLADTHSIRTNLGDFSNPSLVLDSNDMIETLEATPERASEPDSEREPEREPGFEREGGSKVENEPRMKQLVSHFKIGNWFGKQLGKARGKKYRVISCYEPWLTLVVHPNGTLDPCEMMNNVSSLENRGLKSVWFNDNHINSMRKQFLSGKLPLSCQFHQE